MILKAIHVLFDEAAMLSCGRPIWNFNFLYGDRVIN
jgi:hypothetical protein